jgi:hypothetical protein
MVNILRSLFSSESTKDDGEGEFLASDEIGKRIVARREALLGENPDIGMGNIYSVLSGMFGLSECAAKELTKSVEFGVIYGDSAPIRRDGPRTQEYLNRTSVYIKMLGFGLDDDAVRSIMHIDERFVYPPPNDIDDTFYNGFNREYMRDVLTCSYIIDG